MNDDTEKNSKSRLPADILTYIKQRAWHEPFEKEYFLEQHANTIEKASGLGLDRIGVLINALIGKTHEQLGFGTVRDRHANAIKHFKLFKKDRSHFITLLRQGDEKSARDMVYFANRPLERDMERSDPAQYKALTEALLTFRISGYHRTNPEAIISAMAIENQRRISREPREPHSPTTTRTP